MSNSRKARPPRRRQATETSEYVAMLTRILYGYGHRIEQDPAALVHLRDLQAAFNDAVNLGMFLANRGPNHYSINEQAAMLSVSKQAVHKRVNIGEEVYVRLEAAKAAGPVVRLADVRTARAAGLHAASVPDITGSERERRAAANE